VGPMQVEHTIVTSMRVARTYRFGRFSPTPGVGIKWVDSRYRLDELLRRLSAVKKGVGGEPTRVGECAVEEGGIGYKQALPEP
jgi:hypothetical protein